MAGHGLGAAGVVAARGVVGGVAASEAALLDGVAGVVWAPRARPEKVAATAAAPRTSLDAPIRIAAASARKTISGSSSTRSASGHNPHVNRTDRLYALVEELRARAPRLMRAAELARRFEVTTRTIERDLLALQAAGVPIWAQPGPGGGYSLNVDATLPPLNLTPAEAAAIATALAATRAMPCAEAGVSALKKLTAVMASAPRDSASRLVSHIRVAPGPNSAPIYPVADVVQQALIDSVAIQLT